MSLGPRPRPKSIRRVPGLKRRERRPRRISIPPALNQHRSMGKRKRPWLQTLRFQSWLWTQSQWSILRRLISLELRLKGTSLPLSPRLPRREKLPSQSNRKLVRNRGRKTSLRVRSLQRIRARHQRVKQANPGSVKLLRTRTRVA